MGRDIHYCECGEEIFDDMECCKDCYVSMSGKIYPKTHLDNLPPWAKAKYQMPDGEEI